MTEKKFLTPAKLAERWDGEISVRTMANWRATGRGPRFVKIGGSVLYDIEEVEAWEKRRTAQSTAEYDKWVE
jgi:hypothetical protein